MVHNYSSGKGDVRRPTDEKKVAENWPADMGPKDGKARRFHKAYGLPTPGASYTKYIHHGKDVFVREDLKGAHREYCLCFRCSRLNVADRDKNCPIANDTFANCVKHGIATPVFECPQFQEGSPVMPKYTKVILERFEDASLQATIQLEVAVEHETEFVIYESERKEFHGVYKFDAIRGGVRVYRPTYIGGLTHIKFQKAR